MPTLRMAGLFALGASTAHLLWTCPFSKVEESFNTQAIHDLLEFSWWPGQSGNELMSFDHLEFPGVVPRTFLGPLAIRILFAVVNILPVPLFISDSLLESYHEGLLLQIACRGLLGAFVIVGFYHFACALDWRFDEKQLRLRKEDDKKVNKGKTGSSESSGLGLGGITLLLSSIQFHLPFYITRTLPNTFALALALVGYGEWLYGRPLRALSVLAFATLIFRCDLLLLVGPLALQMLWRQEILLFPALGTAIAIAVASLILSVVVDSYFWFPRLGWLWPEGYVLLFNTVENRSAEYGTSPLLWYFTSALPRSMHVALPMVVCAAVGLRRPTREGSAEERNREQGSMVYEIFAVLKTMTIYADTDTDTNSGIRRSGAGLGGRKEQSLLWQYLLRPSLGFVGIYSFLPHKELRFIFPAIPLLNAAAALAIRRFWIANINSNQLQQDEEKEEEEEKDKENYKEKSKKKLKNKRAATIRTLLYLFSPLGVFLLVPIGIFASQAFLLASRFNYPGGVALQALVSHHMPNSAMNAMNAVSAIDNMNAIGVEKRGRCEERQGKKGGTGGVRVCGSSRVHIDVGACMSGASRFGQLPLVHLAGKSTTTTEHSEHSTEYISVEYSKEENLIPTDQCNPYEGFDWLISRDLPPYSLNSLISKEETGVVDGMEGVDVWGKALKMEKDYLKGFKVVQTVKVFKSLRPKGYSPKVDLGEEVRYGYLVDLDLPYFGAIKIEMPVVAVLEPQVHILRRKK